MKEIMQFASTKERLKYLSGKFEEIIPKVATPKPTEILSQEELIEFPEEEVKVEEVKAEEKPKKKKAPAKKKTSKKGDKDGEVQAK